MLRMGAWLSVCCLSPVRLLYLYILPWWWYFSSLSVWVHLPRGADSSGWLRVVWEQSWKGRQQTEIGKPLYTCQTWKTWMDFLIVFLNRISQMYFSNVLILFLNRISQMYFSKGFLKYISQQTADGDRKTFILVKLGKHKCISQFFNRISQQTSLKIPLDTNISRVVSSLKTT